MKRNVKTGDDSEKMMELDDERTDSTTNELDPIRFLEENHNQNHRKESVAIVILNSPITDVGCFNRVYNQASYRLCADGGANRLHDLLINSSPNVPWESVLQSAAPNAIHGDLDSLENEVGRRFEKIGVEISKDPDQYSTDFGKAIKKVVKEVPQVKDVLIWGSLGGRVDQGIGLLHELYREQKYRHPEIRFWLFSEASITVSLKPGTTIIHTPLKTDLIQRNIGILPLYGPAIITTRGLEWDVVDWSTEMGGRVSTSNHIVEDHISIKTDRDILFTLERRVGSQTLGKLQPSSLVV